MSNSIEYRRHLIKTMQAATSWSARSFRDKTPTTEVHRADTRDGAIAGVKQELDTRFALLFAGRVNAIPTAAEYRNALAVIGKTDEQAAMLNAHLAAPGHTLTATEIAHAGGYPSYSSANSQYGALARKLAEELEWEPPTFDGKQVWTFALATDADNGGGGVDGAEWRWKLRPEVVEALSS